MAVIAYSQLESALQGADSGPADSNGKTSPSAASVVLIHGEEMLVASALQMMIEALVPADSRGVSYEPVDGAAGSLHEVVEKVCTYPLLGARKVVALLDARLFGPKKNPAQLLKKSKEALASRHLQQAAAYLVDFMAAAKVELDDLTGEGREALLPQEPDLTADTGWLDEVAAVCRQTGRQAAYGADTADLLEKTIERGIPEGNRLVLTTESVDKRKKLYELIRERGLVIDCSVPQGERRADKKAQEAVLQEIKNSLLKKHGKSMEPGAFELLYEMTGFEPRIFAGNLEKLITYAGERGGITLRDVQTILERTKQDPIFAFTNAVTEKNASEALFYLASLLHDPQQPMRPEQIVVAILNQVRKLLRIKEFLGTPAGRLWFAGCSFAQFKAAVLPALAEHDKGLVERIGQWHKDLADAAAEKEIGGAGGKRAAGRTASDLLIAPQPKNPYPVYQMFRKAERYRPAELRQAVERLAQADRQIKSGAENKQLILEKLVWSICGGEDAVDENRLHHRSGK